MVEIVIYTGLTAMIVVALANVMLQVTGTQEKVTTKVTLQQELRTALDRMTYSMRLAQSVQTGASVFDVDGGSLSLAMSGATRHPTLFFLSGSQLFVSEAGAGSGALTTNNVLVDRLLLTNRTATGAAATIRIELHGTDAVTGEGGDYEDEMTLSTSVTLRQ